MRCPVTGSSLIEVSTDKQMAGGGGDVVAVARIIAAQRPVGALDDPLGAFDDPVER